MGWQFRYHSTKTFALRPSAFSLDERDVRDRRGVHKRRLSTTAAEAAILRAFITQCGTSRSGWDGAVSLRISYGQALSKNDSKRLIGGLDRRKPSVDRIAQLVIHALTSDLPAGRLGAWKDEGSVMEVVVTRLPCREFESGNLMRVDIVYSDVVESFTR